MVLEKAHLFFFLGKKISQSSLVALVIKNPSAKAKDIRDTGLISVPLLLLSLTQRPEQSSRRMPWGPRAQVILKPGTKMAAYTQDLGREHLCHPSWPVSDTGAIQNQSLFVVAPYQPVLLGMIFNATICLIYIINPCSGQKKKKEPQKTQKKCP